MVSQLQDMIFEPAGLTGLRTLIEPAGYGFYVFLINKTKKLDASLKKAGLLQTYKDQQKSNAYFKSYMIEKLDPQRTKLNPDNEEIYMICITMDSWSNLPCKRGNPELLCPELPQAISNISYGVLKGGKKSYKMKSKMKHRKTRKHKKTRRYKK